MTIMETTARSSLLILGLGESGRAAAELALRNGYRVGVSEQRTREALPLKAKAWLSEFSGDVELGGHTRRFLEGWDEAVISPGIKPHAPVRKWLRERGIPLMSELDWASRFCRGRQVAVTGTNGKSTVTTLLAELFAAASRRAVACGNLGRAFSRAVLEDSAEVFVVEVSSFQLFDTHAFHPSTAVILNLSENHLDWHDSFEDYQQAKLKIFDRLGPEDTAWIGPGVPEQKERGLTVEPRRWDAESVPFAFENPNVHAAAVVAHAEGIPEDVIRKVVTAFKGLEHRCERVGQWHGISVVNDAKSTTPAATRWALERHEPPIVLLCGGRDKNCDPSVLRSIAQCKVRMLIAYGEARGKISRIFSGVVPLTQASGLRDAVEQAVAHARPGDTILLSPFCSSFDEFRSFEERGRCFKQWIRERMART